MNNITVNVLLFLILILFCSSCSDTVGTTGNSSSEDSIRIYQVPVTQIIAPASMLQQNTLYIEFYGPLWGRISCTHDCTYKIKRYTNSMTIEVYAEQDLQVPCEGDSADYLISHFIYDLNLGYFTIIAKQPTGIEPLEHTVYAY